MKIRKDLIALTAGILIGTALAGPAVQAAEYWLKAVPSTQKFFVDGQEVGLEAYAIEGHNYVKLRDVGEAVGFPVAYDGETNSVIIGNPKAQPDPAVYTDTLTRELYDAIRSAIVSGELVEVPFTEEAWNAMSEVTAAIGSYPVYEPAYGENNTLCCVAEFPESYEDAVVHTQPFVDGLASLPEEDQVRQIALYVCDRLTYGTTTAFPGKVLSCDDVTAGNCMTYAHSFQFLCDRAGIPCILVHSTTHQWNKVYVSGRWWDVDLTGFDTGNDRERQLAAPILKEAGELQGKDFVNEALQVTAFAMELLVPGSVIQK